MIRNHFLNLPQGPLSRHGRSGAGLGLSGPGDTVRPRQGRFVGPQFWSAHVHACPSAGATPPVAAAAQ